MQTPRVLDVGNCDADHAAIRGLLTRHFDVSVERVMFVAQALAALRQGAYALVLVNRRIFADDSDGLALVSAMRDDAALSATPVMLVSNYADAQARAVAAGAVPGFGKAALSAAATVERLRGYLPSRHASAAAGSRE